MVQTEYERKEIQKKVDRLVDKGVIRELENMMRVSCGPRKGSGVCKPEDKIIPSDNDIEIMVHLQVKDIRNEGC